MADLEDNCSLQADEVEALSSIYGEEWCVVDVSNRIYCINVRDDHDKPRWTLCLQVHMPENYPSEAPPQYQLNAPWLRGEERRHIEGDLQDIYCEHLGESIVYLWVEKIREFLLDKTEKRGSEPSHIDHGSRSVTMTTETEPFDDGLDLSALVMSQMEEQPDTSDDWECPCITHGNTVTDRRSTFQPHLAPIFHKKQVKLVIDKLCENKKIANATHNIMAYRIWQDPVFYQGCDDDGETHAGSRMLHLLQILDVRNVMVVVSRWYGGIHLGPDRFKHINNCTRNILEECGYIKEKEEKKGPKSSDKKKR